jgi:hypothetical protein
MQELAQFIGFPLAAIGKYDLAVLNVRWAQGLPGAENIDERWTLEWSHQVARTVQFDTRRHWYRFNEN